MKRHPVEGAKMLRAGGAEPGVVDIALHHHEKIDGTGYPDRLAGDAISLWPAWAQSATSMMP